LASPAARSSAVRAGALPTPPDTTASPADPGDQHPRPSTASKAGNAEKRIRPSWVSPCLKKLGNRKLPIYTDDSNLRCARETCETIRSGKRAAFPAAPSPKNRTCSFSEGCQGGRCQGVGSSFSRMPGGRVSFRRKTTRPPSPFCRRKTPDPFAFPSHCAAVGSSSRRGWRVAGSRGNGRQCRRVRAGDAKQNSLCPHSAPPRASTAANPACPGFPRCPGFPGFPLAALGAARAAAGFS